MFSMERWSRLGEKASGEGLIQQGRLVATDVRGRVIKGSGHWLMEEAPQQVIPALIAFLNEQTKSTERLGARVHESNPME